MIDTLPSTLSGLLRLAVQDCRHAESDGVLLDMVHWYNAATDLRGCSVCMAGAVLLYDVELDDDEELPMCINNCFELQECIDRSVRHKMLAINELRIGNVGAARRHLETALGKVLGSTREMFSIEQYAVIVALEEKYQGKFCMDKDHDYVDCMGSNDDEPEKCHLLSQNRDRLTWDEYLDMAAKLESVVL